MSNAVQAVEDSQEIIEKGDSAGLWPQDLSKEEKKQVAYISAQYGLDPFFNDLQILGGNPYVTSSGLKRNAHESNDPPAAIQVELNDSNENKRWFEYEARLWKESNPDGKPYIEYGEASPKSCNSMISKCDKDLKAMARTRAVNRVLRLAYNINLTSAEELIGYDPDKQEIVDVEQPARDKKKKPNPKQEIINQIAEKVGDESNPLTKKVVQDQMESIADISDLKKMGQLELEQLKELKKVCVDQVSSEEELADEVAEVID